MPVSDFERRPLPFDATPVRLEPPPCGRGKATMRETIDVYAKRREIVSEAVAFRRDHAIFPQDGDFAIGILLQAELNPC